MKSGLDAQRRTLSRSSWTSRGRKTTRSYWPIGRLASLSVPDINIFRSGARARISPTTLPYQCKIAHRKLTTKVITSQSQYTASSIFIHLHQFRQDDRTVVDEVERMKLNISYPANGSQKLIEVEDERRLRVFMDKRVRQSHIRSSPNSRGSTRRFSSTLPPTPCRGRLQSNSYPELRG